MSFRTTVPVIRSSVQPTFCAVFLFVTAILASGLASVTFGATLPPGFSETQIASGLAQPTSMAFAPDGRLFVCQQGGSVRVIKNSALLSAPFVTLTVSSVGERGVLGIAFDPNFAANHFVYIYYTATTPAVHNRVSRFTASGDVAIAGSEVQLLNLPNLSATNHNGGELAFGPDGKLYIGVGENAVASNAQSLATPLGKLLRINPDGSIPTDNPFFSSTTEINRAIWALGLRNPFNFSFDPGSGTLFINDVGQNTWEEINEGIRGANYGWPTTEGPTSDARFVGPIFSYTHSSGCSIIGSTFYRPTTPQFPASYLGKYFFGDFCGGWIRVLDPANDTAADFATGISALVDLQVAADGSLYYLSRGGSSTAGAVFQVRFTQAPSIAAQPQNQTVSVGQTATFSVTASGTPPFTYQWQRNDVAIPGATAATLSFTATSADNGATYRVVVTNARGSATSNRATLTVNPAANPNAPTAAITQPVAGTSFAGGDVIQFAGTGTDPEDGALPAGAFTWEVVLHHDTHTHPFFGPTSGVKNGSITIPTRGETSSNIFYRIHLKVTDSGGRTHEVTRDLLPRTVSVTLASNPNGLQLTLDGQPVTTPHTFTGVVGIIRSIGATTPQALNGQSWSFLSWSDGGGVTHEISTPPAPTTYTATFGASAASNGVLEAESLSRFSPGNDASVQTDSAASGGSSILLTFDEVGDYVEFTTPTLSPGWYLLKFRYSAGPNRGQVIVQVDGGQIGGMVDQFQPSSTFLEATPGSITFEGSTTHRIRLTVTGRSGSSSGYTVSADRFTFLRL